MKGSGCNVIITAVLLNASESISTYIPTVFFFMSIPAYLRNSWIDFDGPFTYK